MRIFGSIGFGPFRFGASGRIQRIRSGRRYYLHSGCKTMHRSASAANRCPNGRI